MNVVFGGEPEPVLDGEICYLRWRFSDLKTEEPVTTLEALSAKIQFDGKEVGPFEPRGSGRNPGMYQTQHIFTKPGDGEVTLSFKTASSDEVLTLTFPFTIRSRKTIEFP